MTAEQIKIVVDHYLPGYDEKMRAYFCQSLQDDRMYDSEESLLSVVTDLLEDESLSDSLARELLSLRTSSPDTSKAVKTRPCQGKIKTEEDRVVPACHSEEATAILPSFRSSRRKARTKKPKRNRENPAEKSSTHETFLEDATEDDSSAWKDQIEKGAVWGGRGCGGRGEYSGAVNSVKSNIRLSNVSLTLPNGTEILKNTDMNITKGHRYGLVGRNGAGKSTLLQRLARKAIPGMPQDMRVLYVQQQVDGSDISAIDVLIEYDIERSNLLREQQEVENLLDMPGISNDDLADAANRLGEIAESLDAIDADSIEERALGILRGLQFSEDMIRGPTSSLSGGWRMRLALARALFVRSDLVLLDECTNHLDLHGQLWLVEYLLGASDRTFFIVSHDRSFLDAVCTDIVRLDHQRLRYHVGNFSEYERQLQAKAEREAHILDAAGRQRSRAEAFIRKQQALSGKKNADQKKQKQAAMVRHKKLDRIGNYRQDGKRYKNQSLKVMSEKGVRLAEKVVIEAEEPIISLNFPSPAWPPAVTKKSFLLTADDFSFGYSRARCLFKSVTLSIDRGSKIALVGKNGCGKTSLIKCLTQELDPTRYYSSGKLHLRQSIRIAHVNQYSVEELEKYSTMEVTDYAEQHFNSGRACVSATKTTRSSGNVRQYLGAFGLGGRHAHQKIGKLSGGERMRLCFAAAMVDEPHLLFLDESTNHVDIETLDALSNALNSFDGSILMVSHNQVFLSQFCNTLWVLDDGIITVSHNDTESFDDLFSNYRSTVSDTTQSLSARRHRHATMAKTAAQLRSGASQSVALL